MLENKFIVGLQNLDFYLMKKKKRVGQDKEKFNNKVFNALSLLYKPIDFIENSLASADAIKFFLVDLKLVNAYIPHQCCHY